MHGLKSFKCPNCDGGLKYRAMVDSSDRVETAWVACEKCDYDSRTMPNRAPTKDEIRDGHIQALESRDDEIKRLNIALTDARKRLKGAGMLGSDEAQ